jgi:hypothetical protein
LRIVVVGFCGLGNDAIGSVGTGANDAIGTAGFGTGTDGFGSGAIGTGIDGFGAGALPLQRSRSRFHTSYGLILLL